MSEELYTTIKTDEGDVRVPHSDKEMQKVVTLVYWLDLRNEELEAKMKDWKDIKAQYEKEAKNCQYPTILIGEFFKKIMDAIE